MAAGWQHSLALRSDGKLWAWGSAEYGQLGNSPSVGSQSPIQIGNNTWSQVAAGWFHTLAIRSDGTLWAWGQNLAGALGDGTTTQRNVPVQIGTDNNWYRVAAGRYHSVGLRTDGTLWAWGYNVYGQLGDGSFLNRTTPVQIGSGISWAQISAGQYHSAAVRSDGTLWTWGDNTRGQLGDATNTARSSPVQIGTSDTWTAVAAGGEFTVARNSSGKLWAFGKNDDGQIGDGTTTSRNIPTQVFSADNWDYISAGTGHVLALRSDGKLGVWGLNGAGQLGNGDSASQLLPGINDWRSIGPTAMLLPLDGAVYFGNLNVGSSSGTVIRTLTASPDPINIAAISSASPAFQVTHNCPAFLSTGSSCNVSMSFTATTVGTQYTQLILNTDATISGGRVWLTGNGVGIPPAAPTFTNAVAGNAQVTLTFTPGATGGYPILDFTATCTSTNPVASISVTKTTSPITVSGLSNDVAYTCTVRARNLLAQGQPSAPSSTLIPQTPDITLTVTKSGSGAGQGTVTANIPGINCGADCSEILPRGSVVTLYATTPAGSGVIPAGWSGVTCQENLPGVCTTTLAQSVNAQAAFSTVLALTPRSFFEFLSPAGGRTIPFTVCAGDTPIAPGTLTWQYTTSPIALTVQIAQDLNGNDLIDAGEELSWSGNLPSGLAAGSCTKLLIRAQGVSSWSEGAVYNLNFGVRVPGMAIGDYLDAVIQLMPGDFSTLQINVQGSGTTTPSGPGLIYVREGSIVLIETQPAPGWRLARWSGLTCQNGNTQATCSVLVPVRERTFSISVTAIFEQGLATTGTRLDLTNDGKGDIVWRNTGTGENYLYPMDGRTILGTEGPFRSVSTQWVVAGVGDFDGDGKADLLWRNTSTGENYLYFMDGKTILATEGFIRSVPANWVVAGVGDFDGDGKADILWRNTTTGENYLYFMDGKLIKAAEGYTRSVPTVWSASAVGDFDGDGKADILWRNSSTGENYLYFMDGKLIKATEGYLRSVPSPWVVAGSGDFDGDGKADLLWRNTSTGENYLYFLDGKLIKTTEGFIRSVATSWIAASVTDFDGDGKADILWRNTTTGENYIYPMDGRTIKATEGSIRSVPPAWTVVTK